MRIRIFGLTLLLMLVGAKAMAITVNIYYTGEDGNARKFAEEMEQPAGKISIKVKFLPMI